MEKTESEPENIIQYADVLIHSIGDNPDKNDVKKLAAIKQLLNYSKSDELLSIGRNLNTKIFQCLKDKTIQTSSPHLRDILSLAAVLTEHSKFDWCHESDGHYQWTDELLLLVSTAIVQTQSQFSLESNIDCDLLHSCFLLIEEGICYLEELESHSELSETSQDSNTLICRRLTELQESLVHYLLKLNAEELSTLDCNSSAVLAGTIRLFSSWTSATNWSGISNISNLLDLFANICKVAVNEHLEGSASPESCSVMMDSAGFLMSSLCALWNSSSVNQVIVNSAVKEHLCSLMKIMWPSVIKRRAHWNVTKVFFLGNLIKNIFEIESHHECFNDLAINITRTFPKSYESIFLDVELLEITIDVTFVCLILCKKQVVSVSYCQYISEHHLAFLHSLLKNYQMQSDPSLSFKIQQISENWSDISEKVLQSYNATWVHHP